MRESTAHVSYAFDCDKSACAEITQPSILTENSNGEGNEVAGTQLEDVVDMAGKTKSEEHHEYDCSYDRRGVVVQDKVDLPII